MEKKKGKKISLKTMHTEFSVDDFSDSFWAAPPGMSRSQSEWAFDNFIEEFSGSGGAIPVSRSGESVIGPSLAEPRPSVSKSEEADGEGDVVEIKRPGNQNHNSPPSDLAPTFSIDSDEYRAILKDKLHQACAAVALSRVFFSLQSLFPIGFIIKYYKSYLIFFLKNKYYSGIICEGRSFLCAS